MKSKEEIIREAIDSITQNTPINNFYAGAIARSIIEAISPYYQDLYVFGKDILDNGYISKADEEHAELIGELFNYPRRTEQVYNSETNEYEEVKIELETYKYELTKQVRAAVSSNEEALRLACLTIPGVQNIIGKEYTYGTGSFSFILVVQNGFDEEEVKSQVEEAIMKTKAFGVRPGVILPEPVLLDLEISLIFQESATAIEKQEIRQRLQNYLYQYYGNFSLAQDFIYHDLVQEVMNIDQKVVDFQVVSLYLRNEPVLLTNHDIMDDERIRPNIIEIL